MYIKDLARRLNEKIFRKDEVDGSVSSPDSWKDQIFRVVLVLLMIAAGPLMLYGGYLFYQDGLPSLTVFEVLNYIFILIIGLSKSIKLPIKKFLTILNLYILGVVLLIFTGTLGAGMMSVVLTFVLASAFLTKKQNTMFFGVNIITFVVLTLLMYQNVLDDFGIAYYKGTWLINALVAQFCILFILYISNLNFRGLKNQSDQIIESMNLLKKKEEQYRLILENMGDVVFVVNLMTNRYVYISPSVERLKGYSPEEILQVSPSEHMTPDSAQRAKEITSQTLESFLHNPQYNEVTIDEIQEVTKSGEHIWMETTARYRRNENNEVEAVGVSRNITERKRKEAEISFLDTHDRLTGLLNRNAVGKRIKEDNSYPPAIPNQSVILLNIDKFRVINDSMGHWGGDRLLIEIAEMIKRCVGSAGQVYRYGGDEFVAILEGLDEHAVRSMAKEILKAIYREIRIGNRIVLLTACLGVCLCDHSSSLEKCIQNADTAMYVAKRDKNKIVEYSSDLEKIRTQEELLGQDMQEALEKEEFELYFQPIYNNDAEITTHAEALLRWNHPEFGMVSPGIFIPVAERTRMIIPITQWILKEACRTVALWRKNGIENMSISINLSFLSFENRGRELIECITEAVSETKIEPSSIWLEITESTLMYDLDEVTKVLQELKDKGYTMVLDDFGTGYSSFGYLKDLPLDIVKLDRTLITQIETSGRAQTILKSLTTIIHDLGYLVVVEGVENESQLELLRAYRCDFYQGFLFGKPLPSELFIAGLK